MAHGTGFKHSEPRDMCMGAARGGRHRLCGIHKADMDVWWRHHEFRSIGGHKGKRHGIPRNHGGGAVKR